MFGTQCTTNVLWEEMGTTSNYCVVLEVLFVDIESYTCTCRYMYSIPIPEGGHLLENKCSATYYMCVQTVSYQSVSHVRDSVSNRLITSVTKNNNNSR